MEEDVGMFYDPLVYFTSIWYILRPMGLFYGHLVYFFGKNLATLLQIHGFKVDKKS
jgi:hypothetical protein